MESSDFTPDYLSPPGDTIRDAMQEMDVTVIEFAAMSQLPVTTIVWLMQSQCHSITHKEATGLALATDTTPIFWIKRWDRYRSEINRLGHPQSWWEVGSRRAWRGEKSLRRCILEWFAELF